MKKIVAIHGSYFANNFGDTLLIKLLCDRVAAEVGKENVYLAVNGCTEEQELIGYPVVAKDRRDQVTHLVYGGGGYLGEPNYSFLSKLKWYVRNYFRHFSWMGSFSSAKLSIIGVGFGPITNLLFRRIAEKKISKAEYVLLRDEESLQFFKSYGFRAKNVSTCVDLALSLTPQNIAKTRKIALHIADLANEEIRAVFDALSNSSLVGDSDQIDIIFDNVPNVDTETKEKYFRASAEKFAKGQINFFPYDGVDKLLERIESYELVITSKLHVGITTIALGGKVISIPRHQKTMRLYKQLDLADFCVNRDARMFSSLSLAMSRLNSFRPNIHVIQQGLHKINDTIPKALQ